MKFDLDYVKCIAYQLFNVDSPSGFFTEINQDLQEILGQLGYSSSTTKKGNVMVKISGQSSEKTVAISAHLDTLGLMVRSINGDGTLNITNIGGPLIPTLDGEYCIIHTRTDRYYTGTILNTSPSVHVFEDAKTSPRDLAHMIVRIDEKVKTKKDVLELGIQNGDYIFIEPKFTITDSDFIKSRFIDDKGSVCAILGVLKKLADEKMAPKYDTLVYFVNHEEVGHGAATISSTIDEFVTVDMGCIGKDLAGNEYAVSIAAKDSHGPYDYELTTRLVNLAKEHQLNYVVDIFPFYGSDVDAAFTAGLDFKGALIGPGVHASHGMERTHMEAIDNTMKLILLYLIK